MNLATAMALTGLALLMFQSAAPRASVSFATQTAQTQQPASPVSAAPLTNEDVIALAKAGFSDDLIIDRIRGATVRRFELDTATLVSLKRSGVSERVLREMLGTGPSPSGAATSASASPASAAAAASEEESLDPGIYVETSPGTPRWLPLEPTVFSQGRTAGILMSAITYGMKKAKWKAVVAGARGNTRLQTVKPLFQFRFEKRGPGLSHTGVFDGWMAGASSPNEFVLARMTQKDRSRELIVGEFGLLGASAGTRSDDTVDMTIERLGGGVYRVTPATDLERGAEYCFFYAAGSASFGGGASGKLFDFGIDGPAAGGHQ